MNKNLWHSTSRQILLQIRPDFPRRNHAAARPRRRPHPHRAAFNAGKAAANTTSRAACANVSGRRPPSAPRWWTTRSAISSRISSCRAAWTRTSSCGVPDDGIGRSIRNGLNFTERGFGIRGAVGVPDRGHSAAVAAQARRFRLGPHFRQARRALVPHRRHFRRVVRNHGGSCRLKR